MSQSPHRISPAVYDDLKEIARRFFARQPRNHTLQATALVHEAFVKLAGRSDHWENETHFKAVAAKAMRQILIDHARGKKAEKHGGGVHRISLSGDEAGLHGTAECDVDLVALHEALEALAKLDPRKAEVVELRFFGGLSIVETAEALGVSHMTVSNDWAMARAWIAEQLTEPDTNT